MYNMCSCKCGDYCPLGKRGSEIRCTADELRDKLRELIPTKEVNLSEVFDFNSGTITTATVTYGT